MIWNLKTILRQLVDDEKRFYNGVFYVRYDHVLSLLSNFGLELIAKRDKEQSFIKKGHLSKESTEVARVLVLRFNEILGVKHVTTNERQSKI